MSDGLREAARRALAELGEGPAGEVTRVTLDVKIDETAELVTVALRAGALRWSTSGTDLHVRAALSWLAGTDARRTTPEPPARLSWSPPSMEAPVEEANETPARVRLADALDDVVTEVVRAGVNTPDSPSIAESLERLRKELPLPLPSGIARWLGRLRVSLDRGDAADVARLLDGASRLAANLRKDKPGIEGKRFVVGWLGTGGELGGVERMSDRTFVEVARELLASSERGGVERRYLVDLHDGEVFREERSRSEPVASVGPCPRVINVGLAEVEEGPTPRRIRLMQYAVTPALGNEELRQVEANGYRRFEALADGYRTSVTAYPGQAEPFAVVVPARWNGKRAQPICYDAEDVPLAFARADDPAAVEVLAQFVTPAPRWVAGRLVDAKGYLLMIPCVIAVDDGEATRLHRLR